MNDPFFPVIREYNDRYKKRRESELEQLHIEIEPPRIDRQPEEIEEETPRVIIIQL